MHPKYRTPFKGTWFFGILTAIAGGFININVLFELVNIGTLSAFIIVSAGILWMRKTQRTHTAASAAPGRAVHADLRDHFLLHPDLRFELGDLGAFRNLVRPWFDRVFRVQPQAFRIERARTVLKTGRYGCFRYIFRKIYRKQHNRI